MGIYLETFCKICENWLFFLISSVSSSNNKLGKNTLRLLRPSVNNFDNSYNLFSKKSFGLFALNSLFIFGSSNINFFNKNNLSLISSNFLFVSGSSDNKGTNKKDSRLIEFSKNGIS